MRVALDSMAKDFRNAGFLIDGAAVDPDVGTLTSITIQSRAGAVGIVSPAGIPDTAGGDFVLSDAEQGSHFPVGTYVGAFTPMSRSSFVGGGACKVVAQNAGDKRLIKLKQSDGISDIVINTFKTDGQTALILVPLASAAVTPAQTIKSVVYDFGTEVINSKTVSFLRRTEAGNARFLARGITGTFEPKKTTMADGSLSVNRVMVTLEGETDQLSNDAIGSQKTRSLRTVFNLRNI